MSKLIERPATPLALPQQNALPLDLDDGRVGSAIAVHEEVDRGRLRRFEERVFRADERGVGGFVVERQARLLAVAVIDSLRRTALREVLEHAVGAEHVRRAHAADAAVMSVLRRARRIVGRQVEERGRHPRSIEKLPERFALPVQMRSRTGDRLGDGVDRPALVVRIAVDEVEDAVRARPGAVDEAGPRDRTLRRNAGAQVAETARGTQPREVRHLPGVEHPLAEPWIHAVHADDDDLLAERARRGPAAAQPVRAAADRGGGRGGGRGFEEGAAGWFAIRRSGHEEVSQQ